MIRRDELLALAERVEALTGPDRDVDAEIALAVNGGEIVWLQANGTMESYPARKYASGNHVGGYGKAPVDPFTASIDAAMTLVPKEYSWTLGQNVHHKHWVCSVNYLNDEGVPTCLADSGSRFTPALALTAAALRAIAEQQP